jgi:tetratricopeptide (TPR) repeat protein
MESRNLVIAVRSALFVLALVLALATFPAQLTSYAAQDLPESPDAQPLVNGAEEIFHVHPERASQDGAPLLQRVLEQYPGTRQASLALAYLSYGHHALGDTEAAARYQEQLEATFPGSMALGECHLLRGEAWFKAGDKERARQCYARAVEILNQHLDKQDGRLMRWWAADKLVSFYEHSDPQQAVNILMQAAQALRSTPQQVLAWRQILKIVGAHSPGDVPSVPSLTQVSDDDLSGLDPESRAAAMLALAQNDIETDEYVTAMGILARLRAAYAASSHMPGVLLASADLAKRLNPQDSEQVLRLWNEAVERYPRDERVSNAHFALARHYAAAADVSQALAHLRAVRDNALFVAASRGLACLELGDIYRAQGNDAEAGRCYQDARVLGAGTDPAWQAVRKLEAMGITP